MGLKIDKKQKNNLTKNCFQIFDKESIEKI